MATKTKTTKTEPTLSAAFKKRNAAFKAATKAGKRVMIAKDVLAQLKAEKIIAQRGSWAIIKADKPINYEDEVCNIIDAKGTTCTCCALGSMMISEIRMNDRLIVDAVDADRDEDSETLSLWHSVGDVDSYADDEMYNEDRLRSYFSEEQIALIENAFEQGSGEYSCSYTTDHLDIDDELIVAEEFGDRYENPEDRLVAIMKNIIKNKGTFVP